MSMILPDILRSLVTNVMLVLLLYTLAEPRAGKMIRYFSLAVIVLTGCPAIRDGLQVSHQKVGNGF